MSKNFIRVIAVLLTLVISCAFSLNVTAREYTNTAKALRFNDDGSFRVMHVTDTHLEYSNLDATVWLIASTCDREQPDMIALTGDIAMSDNKQEMVDCIDALMTVFEERNIPVAVCFGNHDIETQNFTPSELMALYNSYSCSISVDEGDMLTGCGTYNVPVLASDSNEIKFNFWVFDSGSGDGEGHYANVPADQVEWYKQKSAELEQSNGGKVDSLVFQHIIVPEVYEALEKHDVQVAYSFEHIYNDGEYYSFSSDFENHGVLNETPCSGYYNHGEFDALVERGDAMGIFTGHDHTNAFSVKYKGINITNSLSTRYNGDAFSSQYGYRIIDLNENDTSSYETYVVHWYDYFTLQDMIDLYEQGDDFGAKLALDIMFKGFFQKFGREFATAFVYAITGRQVSYN